MIRKYQLLDSRIKSYIDSDGITIEYLRLHLLGNDDEKYFTDCGGYPESYHEYTLNDTDKLCRKLRAKEWFTNEDLFYLKRECFNLYS